MTNHQHFSNDLVRFCQTYQNHYQKSNPEQIDHNLKQDQDHYYQASLAKIKPKFINLNRIDYQPIINNDHHHLRTIFNLTIVNWITTIIITFCYFLALLLWLYAKQPGWSILAINLIATGLWSAKWLVTFATWRPLKTINFYEQKLQLQWQKYRRYSTYPLINQFFWSLFLKKAGKI